MVLFFYVIAYFEGEKNAFLGPFKIVSITCSALQTIPGQTCILDLHPLRILKYPHCQGACEQ